MPYFYERTTCTGHVQLHYCTLIMSMKTWASSATWVYFNSEGYSSTDLNISLMVIGHYEGLILSSPLKFGPF